MSWIPKVGQRVLVTQRAQSSVSHAYELAGYELYVCGLSMDLNSVSATGVVAQLCEAWPPVGTRYDGFAPEWLDAVGTSAAVPQLRQSPGRRVESWIQRQWAALTGRS